MMGGEQRVCYHSEGHNVNQGVTRRYGAKKQAGNVEVSRFSLSKKSAKWQTFSHKCGKIGWGNKNVGTREK